MIPQRRSISPSAVKKNREAGGKRIEAELGFDQKEGEHSASYRRSL